MSDGVRIFAGVAFSVAATLLAMLFASRFPGMEVPAPWWLVATAIPALVSLPVCIVLVRQANSNRALTGQLQAALAELQQLSRIDGMTGLLNRSAFFASPLPGQGTHWVLLLDIDRFKDINDTHGHHAGDMVLTELARVLKTWSGPGGICGRLGGEEFAMLLADIDRATAATIAETVRHDTARIRVPTGEGEAIAITISIGLACKTPAMPLEQAIREADAAMYEAKRKGRNQVSVAS